MNRLSFRGAGKLLAGYTIVEVTLFLAISGGILVASTALLSGRQERVRFVQTIDQTEIQLRDIVNDVSTGYFPSNSDFDCSIPNNADYDSVPNIGAGNTEQGSNTGCIFVGKIINVLSSNSGPASFDGDFRVYTIVGTKEVTNQSLQSSRAPFRLLGTDGIAGIVDSYTVQANVKVTSKLVDIATGEQYDSFAILSDFGNQDGIGFSGNASRVKLYGYTEVGQPSSSSSGLSGSGGPRYALEEIEGPLVICLNQDGNGGRQGAVIITKQLTISREIDKHPDECSGAVL